MKKAVAWPYLHFFLRSGGTRTLLSACTSTSYDRSRVLVFPNCHPRASVRFNGAYFVRWEHLKLLAYLSPLRSSVPSRQ